MSKETRFRICPLCEATCGLCIEIEEGRVLSVRGDAADTFSEGYICPKGVALRGLHEDPDRLRVPLLRENGTWREAAWDEAFSFIDERLGPICERHGRNSVGVYLGNPTVHNLALTMYAPVFLKALGTHNIFSASSVDQLPKQLACGLMFGTGLSVPVPDLDRCRYLLVLGANPLESNGSMMTAPNVGERLRRIQMRGGKVVVVDPRVTKTARMADVHYSIVPGTDAYFLFGVVHTLFAEGLVNPGRLGAYLAGLEVVEELSRAFSPESVAGICGIGAMEIRRMARELAAAEGAAVYGRIGTCTQRFGTLASWLPEVIHAITGNLDRPGGAMFAQPAHGAGNSKGKPGRGHGIRFGRRVSRVRGRPEFFGEFPAACMAEEMDTPGEGQIRALFTIAGNPVLSTPNGARLSRALASLELMVSVDVYLNETTRHAHVILPGPSPLEVSHYDLAFSQLSVRNVARYSPPVLAMTAGMQPEWVTMLRLAGIAGGMGPGPDIETLDEMVARQVIERETGLAESAVHGRDTEELLAALGDLRGPERLLDFMLRTGPYGEGFGVRPEGLRLAVLQAHPHGLDLGPLTPRIPEILRTVSGKIELAPEVLVGDVARLRAAMGETRTAMLLIGRRDLRSNNSWMHNVPQLMTGRPRCTLQVSPEDAGRLGLTNGGRARVRSNAGSVEVVVETTADIRPGVVSLPHGWGHDDAETRLAEAQKQPGVNSNLLADECCLDDLSGNAVLCGIPVEVYPVGAGA